MNSRDAILYWWPVIARVGGVVGAFAQAAYSVVTHQSADVAFLGFCGALVAAPTIFPAEAPKVDRGGSEDSRINPVSTRRDSRGGTDADS